MAKIKVAGDAVVVTSSLKLEQLVKMSKYHPNALKATVEEKDGSVSTVYRIAIGASAFSSNSVTFASKNADGFATATITIPAAMSADKKKEYIKDTYGKSLMALNELEQNIVAAEKEFDKAYAALDASIEVE